MRQHIKDAEQHMMDYRQFGDYWHLENAIDNIIDALKESMDDTPDDKNGD